MLNNIYNSTKEKMNKSLHVLSDEFKKIRSGKASPALVENISIDYYGTKTPLKQIASIASPESKLIVIQPWDHNALVEIEKAILSSDIGITPSNDGKFIRLNFPPLSEEQRTNLTKIVHKKGEDTKVSIRNIRRDSIHEIEKEVKDKILTEDDEDKGKKEVQKFTDDFIKKIDELVAAKSSEIMEV